MLAGALGVGVVAIGVVTLARHRARLQDLLGARILELRAIQARLAVAERDLQLLAVTDSLTGLANRRAFDQRFQNEWLRAQRDQRVLSVIVLDLDRLEGLNTVFGYEAGDECLRSVGSLLRETARRPGDFAARAQGDEFVVLLAETSLVGAQSVAEAIRRRVEKLPISHSASIAAGRVTVSAGVASTIPAQGDDPAHLLAAASEALDRAQAAGGNRISSIVLRAASWSVEPAADDGTVEALVDREATDPMEIVARLTDFGEPMGDRYPREQRLALGIH